MDDGLNASTDGTDIYIDAASMLVRVSDDAEEGKLSEYGSTNDGYAATEGNGALTLSVNGESNRSLEWSKAEYGESADVTMIQKASIYLTELTDSQRALADVNVDGRVSIVDTTCVQKYLAEYTTGCGSTGQAVA